jgi:hypothetical protein
MHRDHARPSAPLVEDRGRMLPDARGFSGDIKGLDGAASPEKAPFLLA